MLVMVLCFLVANTSHDSNVITSEFIMHEWCLEDIYLSGKPTRVVFKKNHHLMLFFTISLTMLWTDINNFIKTIWRYSKRVYK